MTLNPLVQEILAALPDDLDPAEGLTPEEFRAVYNEQRTATEGEGVTSVENQTFPGREVLDLPARVFRPAGADDEHYAAPIRATDLSGLPPAWVVIAEFDPLRDEGAADARALAGAGADTHYECASGLVHGFWSFADVVLAAGAVSDTACARLAAVLA